MFARSVIQRQFRHCQRTPSAIRAFYFLYFSWVSARVCLACDIKTKHKLECFCNGFCALDTAKGCLEGHKSYNLKYILRFAVGALLNGKTHCAFYMLSCKVEMNGLLRGRANALTQVAIAASAMDLPITIKMVNRMRILLYGVRLNSSRLLTLLLVVVYYFRCFGLQSATTHFCESTQSTGTWQ